MTLLQLPALRDGLYVVRQYREDKGVYHTAVLDVGNRLQLGVPFGGEPTVVHLPPDGLRADRLSRTGVWEFVREIVDEAGARTRLHEALRRPQYQLLSNNCEHFVHFVEAGVPRSPQLAIAGLLTAAVIGMVLIARG